MVSLHFLDNDRLAKNNKVAGYQLLHPTPIVVVIVSFFSFQLTSDFCNVYSQAAHFRSGFSGGEIHDLRRLRREGSPERLSRS
mgnify:CR=1 FL=1